MIVLKRDVNKLFTAKGLPELTVDIQNGVLCIVGRACGKPVMQINGVVPKQSMTKEVRSIVMDDYIIPVLTTFEKEFKKFIKAKMLVKTLSDAQEAAKNATCNIKIPKITVAASGYNVKKHFIVQIINGNTIGSVYPDNKFHLESGTEKELLKNLELLKKVQKEAVKYFKITDDLKDAMKKATECEQKLITSCGW